MSIVSSKFRAYLSHSEPITANQLIVEYDNASYQVKKDSNGGYGNNGLTTNSDSFGLPFYIRSEENNQTAVYTRSAGQHTIKISEYTPNIETSECFKKAVKSVGGGVMMLNLVEDEPLSIEGATWQEAYDALASGTMLYLDGLNAVDGRIMPCVFYDATTIAFEGVTINNSQVVLTTVVWYSDGTATKFTANYPSNN